MSYIVEPIVSVMKTNGSDRNDDNLWCLDFTESKFSFSWVAQYVAIRVISNAFQIEIPADALYPWEEDWQKKLRIQQYPERYSSVTVLGNSVIDGTYQVSQTHRMVGDTSRPGERNW